MMSQFLSGRFSVRFSRKAVLASLLAASTFLSACGTTSVSTPLTQKEASPTFSGGKLSEAQQPA